jgi:hypothetical protein
MKKRRIEIARNEKEGLKHAKRSADQGNLDRQVNGARIATADPKPSRQAPASVFRDIISTNDCGAYSTSQIRKYGCEMTSLES